MSYKFKSLGTYTNFLMDQYSAVVSERDSYFVIKTPDRADYFWGNYILMKDPPKLGCFKEWIQIFEKEIGKRSKLGYCAITFDFSAKESVDTSEFKKNHFDVSSDITLVAQKVIRPTKYNEELVIKEYDLRSNIDAYVEAHFDKNWKYGTFSEQKNFLISQAKLFCSLVDSGVAKRFGAFFGEKLIADLGIYWKDNTYRFNSVSTHNEYRRKGACSTLVYEVTRLILEQNKENILVMQADSEYHAAKIYESVGFKAQEKLIALEWTDPKKFPATSS